MSQPNDPSANLTRLQRSVEAMERPLLILAVVAVGLDLFELSGLDTGRLGPAFRGVTLLVDLAFVLDLVLKLVAFGRSYTETPWFLIDLLSCLPVLDGIAGGVILLAPARVFRGFRILRVLRGLRVLRALRSVPLFERVYHEAQGRHREARSRRLVNLGMLGLTGLTLVSVVLVRRHMERTYVVRVDAILAGGVTRSGLYDLGGGLERPAAPYVMVREADVDGRRRTVYFDFHPIDHRIDQFEFFLTVGMVFAMAMFLYIMTFHERDVTQAQLRGLLSMALPSQVAETFVSTPDAYNQRSRGPATVLFMDFVGFSRICEELADDPDKLSSHLEAAMGQLVGELARHDMILDKFIGDAVMSFRGGPLVPDEPAEHARRAVLAALGSVSALASLDDPYFRSIKIGGASSANCIVGAFGTCARLSYTILGDGVNLAARLEPASAQCGTQNLFDETTYHFCQNEPGLVWRRWGKIRVAGRKGPVQVYEVFDGRDLANAAFIATFHLGLEAFERRDVESALDLFRLSDSQRAGGDPPSRVYARRCEPLARVDGPVAWEPVFETHK